jgi:ClpP class serine protease
VTQPSFEAPRRLLGIEIEEEIGGRREEGRVALQNGLVDEVLGNERFAEALRADQDDVFGLGQEVEAEQALDERAIEGLGPVPFEVGDRLEAAETRALEAALERWSLKP